MVLKRYDRPYLLENGRELHAAGCKMARRYVPAHSAALLVLTRGTSRPVAPPMLTQSVRRIPSATASATYIPGLSSSHSEALASREVLLVRLAAAMSRSGSTASGTRTRGNVTRIPLRGGTVE